MTAFRLIVLASARHELERLPDHVQSRFKAKFPLVAEDPFRKRPGVDLLALEGRLATFRLRVGDYRGIYEVSGEDVVFLHFGHRSTAYR